MASVLNILLVDDEPLARQRLAAMLGRAGEGVNVVAQAGDAGAALGWLENHPGASNLVLLDIQMPGPDGLRLADKLRGMPAAPMVVFVTAHTEHALKAFELEALDYLTKPVRQDRLEQTLARCRKQLVGGAASPQPSPSGDEQHALLVQDRGRLVRVPLPEVLYLRAELKYVTLRTAEHSFVLDESLSELEERVGSRFIRVHRNALVARSAMQILERRDDAEGNEGWAVQIRATGEWLAVSRRQIAAVRDALEG